MSRPTLLFILYLVALSALAFLPLDGLGSGQPVEIRLQVFRTINYAFRKGLESQQFLVLLGNLVAFLPLGLLLPAVTGQRSLLMVLGAAIGLSVGMEFGQLAVSSLLGWAYRSPDVDDVIVNVAGALIGYSLVVLASWLRPGRLTPRS